MAIEVYKYLAKLNSAFLCNFVKRNHIPHNLQRDGLSLLPPAKYIHHGINSLGFIGRLLLNDVNNDNDNNNNNNDNNNNKNNNNTIKKLSKYILS